MRLDRSSFFPRLVNPYVQPILYVRKPGDDHEQVFNFPDDDPFFSEVRTLLSRLLYFTQIPQVSNWVDVIEDIEEDPDAAQILSSYEGAPS